MIALANCDVFTGDEVLHDHAVLIEGDSIKELIPLSGIGDVEVVDLQGASLAPGFIDMQVNGGGGVLFNDDPSIAGLRTISEAHQKFGTLNFCPTMITAEFETLVRGAQAVRDAMGAGLGIVGLHLEGPYITAAKAGVHDRAQVRSASESELASLLDAAGEVLRVLTVAPEAFELRQIERVSDTGVRVFLGHTDATYAQALEAFAAGACGVTHLFNAMSQLTGREPGVVGASLATTDSWAGIIADGYHVDFGSVRAAKNAKPKRLVLVTDAMPPVGQPDMSFVLGPYEIECRDGKCTTSDGVLAGSALDLATAVRNCVQKCGIPKDEALRMASTHVADLLGVDDRLGRIAGGKLADLVILNGQMYVEGVVRRGVLTRF